MRPASEDLNPPSTARPAGGIGRRAGLKHLWETVPVRLRRWVQSLDRNIGALLFNTFSTAFSPHALTEYLLAIGQLCIRCHKAAHMHIRTWFDVYSA